MRTVLILICFVLILEGCRTTMHTYQPAPVPETAQPKMIFLSFRIQRDSTGSTITLLDKKALEGKIKGEPQTTDKPEHLVISVVGRSHRVLYSEKILHPLFRDVETTNDRGEFEHKTVTLTEAEFFIRMRLPEGSDWVLVEEIVGNKRINSAEFQLSK